MTDVRDELDMHFYQDDAVVFMLKIAFCALWIDLGLGKTIVCLTFIVYWLKQNPASRVLVIAPLRVATQTWPNEIPQWEHTADLDFTVIRAEDDDQEVRETYNRTLREVRADERFFDASSEDSAKTASKVAAKAKTAIKAAIRTRKAAEPTRLHIINVEQIAWLVEQHCEWVKSRTSKKLQVKITTWPYDVVIIDEADKFQDYKSQRFRMLKACRTQGFIKRLIELTATPAADSFMGLFSQLFLVDMGERLGRNITAYRDRYFSKYGDYTYKLRADAKDEIGEKVADITLVMDADTYLPRDRAVVLTRPLVLDQDILDRYKRFERQFVFELPDGEIIEAETAAALGGKLVQLSSGALYDAAGTTRVIHDTVLDDLEQLIDELHGSPLLIAYWYRSSLQRLKKRFPVVEMDKAGKRVKDWNAGKIDLLLVHPASVGHGLNMQLGPGHDIYFFDAIWSNKLYSQIVGRIDRQGAKHRARVHLPRVRGTAHDDVYDKNGLKQDAQSALKQRIQRLRNEYG